MNKFAIPQWDSNLLGDTICNKLFKNPVKKLGKIKKKGIQKFQDNGKIQKTKNKQKQLKINAKKALKHLKTNAIKSKDLVNIGKNRLLRKQDESDSKKELLDSPNAGISNEKGVHIDQKRNKHFLQSGNNILGNLSEVKKIKNIRFNSKKDQEKVSLLSENIETPIKNNLKTNGSMNVQNTRKKKKKDFDHLRGNISKKKACDLKTNKDKIKEFCTLNIGTKKNKIMKSEKEKVRGIGKNVRLQNISSTENSQNITKKNRQKLTLRERMMEKLKVSRFRYLNEQMYSLESKDAQNLFINDPDSFEAYHEGYRKQVSRWPINPIDVIIKSIRKMPKSYVVADFGCGDAKLSREVEQKVHSFDLVAANEDVTACDMAHVPLKKDSVDVVVFCLSLMGTNLHDYLREANRVLKIGGVMKIAEVESRFDDVDNFIKGVQLFGFQNIFKDFSHDIFYFIDFKKEMNIKKTRKLPTLSLHPCLYKKR